MTQVTPLPKKKRGPKKKNVVKAADRLFSLAVRRVGRCEIDDGRECNGALQCAHGFSRSYKTVRWDRRNAFSACAGHHLYYTMRPLEWDEFLQRTWGRDLYREMRTLALSGPKPDVAAILDRLQHEARRA